MITYLTISCITLCFCRITYLWVIHKREKALVDYSNTVVDYRHQSEIEENDIIVTDSATTTNVFDSTIGMFPSNMGYYNRGYFIPLREDKQDFLPKKKIKYHTLEEPIEYYSENEAEDEVDISIYNDFRNLNRENG